MKLNQKLIGAVIISVVILICMNIRTTELSDRAIVQALGVDYENGHYQLTVQFYNPSTDNEPAKSQTKVVSGKGDTIAEAIDDINRKNSRELYFSHNSFIAVGLSCASSNMSEVLDYFHTDTQTRPDVSIILTDTAADLIKFTSDENTVPAQSVVEILENAIRAGILPDMRMYEALRMRAAETSEYILPLVAVGEETVTPNGSCVFYDDALALYLDEEQTRGYNWIRGDVKDAFLSVETNLLTASLEIKSAKSKIEVKTLSDTVQFNVNIDLQTRIKGRSLSDEELDLVKKNLEKTVRSQAEDAVETALIENGCDIFEFGARLRRIKPNVLTQYKNWSSTQNIQVSVSVQSHIE